MAEIIFIIPDDKLQRVLDAYDNEFRPDDISQSIWAKKMLRNQIIDKVFQYERQEAVNIANNNVVMDTELVEE